MLTETAFNPKHYVMTARQTWDKRIEFLDFIESNKHLALPYHVIGLQDIIPPAYPGENTVILAKGHHGKSTVLRDYVHKSQLLIEGKEGYAVGMVSHEDVAERIAGALAARYDSPLQYQDDQFIYIGRSFGMRSEQVAELHMTNIITSLEYGLQKFGEKMRYSAIFNDYMQRQPADPHRREMVRQEQKRLQIADDMQRWSNVAVQFECPVFNASQALLKQERSNYSATMRIPGAADTEESKEIYNYAETVFSYWQPKHEYPVGLEIDDSGWKFKVEYNLMFVRVLKRKYAEDMGYPNIVGRVFPLHIEKNGDITYDPEFHNRIYSGGL